MRKLRYYRKDSVAYNIEANLSLIPPQLLSLPPLSCLWLPVLLNFEKKEKKNKKTTLKISNVWRQKRPLFQCNPLPEQNFSIPLPFNSDFIQEKTTDLTKLDIIPFVSALTNSLRLLLITVDRKTALTMASPTSYVSNSISGSFWGGITISFFTPLGARCLCKTANGMFDGG